MLSFYFMIFNCVKLNAYTEFVIFILAFLYKIYKVVHIG